MLLWRGGADTEGFYTLVQERILARYGKTFDWSLKAKMMGKKAIEAARVFVEEMGLADVLTPEAFLEEREGMLQQLFTTTELMPGPPLRASFSWHHPSIYQVTGSQSTRHLNLAPIICFRHIKTTQH